MVRTLKLPAGLFRGCEVMKILIFNFQFSISRKKIIFSAIFILLGLISLQIPISILVGAKVKFTLFDLFAPISGAFLGSFFGIFAVVVMQLFNLIIHGFTNIDNSSVLKLAATLRFLPMVFGVWFFARPSRYYSSSERSESRSSRQARTIERLILLIPLLSIIIFNLHPVGRTVWFYSLFWFIPLLAWPLRRRFLVARSLGSTFTAHAVGGAVWIWAFNLPAAVWISLIPVVILERSIFALGISASYIFLNNILALLSKNRILTGVFSFDKKYVFGFLK